MTKTQANEPGFVLVPREPTEAMLDAAHEVPIACFEDDVECFTTNREATSLYRAMLAVAPPVPLPAYGGVRALEWSNIGRCVGWTAEDEHTHLYHAKGLDRLYEVARGKVGWWAKWQGAFHAKELPSLEEAKAAAQADYERRVLSCLSCLSPVALEEADDADEAAFAAMSEAELLAGIDLHYGMVGEADAKAGEPTDLEEACKPWEFATGEPPEWDSPLHQVFVAGMTYSEGLLAKLLDVQTYEGGDGSEDFDRDVTMSLVNILAEARLWDRDENRSVATPSTPSPQIGKAGAGPEDVGSSEWCDRAERSEWAFMAKMLREAIDYIAPVNLSGLGVAEGIAKARAEEGWRTKTAGAGPVGEAVAWLSRQDHGTGLRIVSEGWVAEIGWSAPFPVAARSVEKPGEVERPELAGLDVATLYDALIVSQKDTQFAEASLAEMRERLEKVEAENAKLRDPEYFWDYEDPESGYAHWRDALDEIPLGEVAHLLTGSSLPPVWVATRVLTVDDDGSPDETEGVLFHSEDEAERCFDESLQAARAALTGDAQEAGR